MKRGKKPFNLMEGDIYFYFFNDMKMYTIEVSFPPSPSLWEIARNPSPGNV
jgi:hypothetical protein